MQCAISDQQESTFLAVGDTMSFLEIDEDQVEKIDVLLRRADETIKTLSNIQKSLEDVITHYKELEKSQDSAKSTNSENEVKIIGKKFRTALDSINAADKNLTDITHNLNLSSNLTASKCDDQELKANYNFLITGKIMKIQDLLINMTPIGHGGEGRVFRGELRGSGQPVVVKSYFMDCEQSSRIEFAIMTLAKNVPGVKKPIALVNTPTNFFLIVEDELYTIPLDNFMANQRLGDTQIQCIFSQMVRIVHDLNQKFIKHRDIKLENFLLNTKSGCLSIIDFGWSMYSAIDFVTIDEVRRSGETLMGTTDYLPPENNSPSGTIVSYEKAVVYALGCILLELFFGYQGRLSKIMPSDGIASLLASLAIKTGQKIPKGVHSLLDKCTRINLNERLTLEGVLNHPWLLSNRRDLKMTNKLASVSRQKFKSYEL